MKSAGGTKNTTNIAITSFTIAAERLIMNETQIIFFRVVDTPLRRARPLTDQVRTFEVSAKTPIRIIRTVSLVWLAKKKKRKGQTALPGLLVNLCTQKKGMKMIMADRMR